MDNSPESARLTSTQTTYQLLLPLTVGNCFRFRLGRAATLGSSNFLIENRWTRFQAQHELAHTSCEATQSSYTVRELEQVLPKATAWWRSKSEENPYHSASSYVLHLCAPLLTHEQGEKIRAVQATNGSKLKPSTVNSLSVPKLYTLAAHFQLPTLVCKHADSIWTNDRSLVTCPRPAELVVCGDCCMYALSLKQ